MPTSTEAVAADPSKTSGSSPPPRPAVAGLGTRAVHGGEARHKPGDAVTDAIFCAATYTFASNRDVVDFVERDLPREEYGRYGNPNERVVERKLAALEGGEAAVLFSTGMSAMVTVLLANLSAGQKVVFFDECYRRSREFCLKHLTRFGVQCEQVRTGDFEALEAAITPETGLLISESPTNPHLTCIDVERFADLGRRCGVDTLIDATLATPCNMRPLEHGVDYVMHSATKYLGGHNDLLAGVLVASAEKLAAVRNLRGIMGPIASPHTGYLLQRGLKTFALRMAQHNRNGLAVARFLADHPKIDRVYYPGLPDHPSHVHAERFMTGYGGLLTFEVAGGAEEAARVVDAVRIPRIGPSLGGVESLIEHVLSMSYYSLSPAERRAIGIADNMVRLSCGIEDTADLLADLDQALAIL